MIALNRLLRRRVPLYYVLISIPVVYLVISFIGPLWLMDSPTDDLEGGKHHHQHHKKTSQAYLAVAVMSSPDEYSKRQTIRETWLLQDSAELLSYFVVGTNALTAIESSLLQEEHKRYNDLILIDSLTDKYSALTLKLLETMKWLNEHVEFRYFLKADVDSYVRVQSIILELQKDAPASRYYWGYFDGNAPVYRKSKKWAEHNWYLCDKYIPYAVGGGYILSQDLVEFVAENAAMLKLYNAEDATLGSWLAPLEIERRHDRRFDTEYMSRGCHGDYLITHKQSPKDIRQKHANLMNTGNICGGVNNEYYTRGAYDYDWNVAPSKCCKRHKDYH